MFGGQRFVSASRRPTGEGGVVDKGTLQTSADDINMKNKLI